MFMGGEDLRRWARGASPGSSRELGIGAAVPAATQGALRSLVEGEMIDIVRQRVGPERYKFVVQRRSRKYVEAAPAPRRGGVRKVRAGTAERRILRLLLEAVRRGDPCPTNEAIARAVGLSGKLAASYRLGQLVARGLIRVEVPSDPRMHRVVTIVASGKSTKGGPR